VCYCQLRTCDARVVHVHDVLHCALSLSHCRCRARNCAQNLTALHLHHSSQTPALQVQASSGLQANTHTTIPCGAAGLCARVCVCVHTVCSRLVCWCWCRRIFTCIHTFIQ